jgi:hypothetical protein
MAVSLPGWRLLLLPKHSARLLIPLNPLAAGFRSFAEFL